MNKPLGYFYKVIGTILDYLIRALIFVVGFLVNLFSSFRQALLVLLSMGGCLIFVLIFNTAFFNSLRGKPLLLVLIILIFVFPFIGTVAVSYLKYIHYMVTEYFFDRSDFYLLGRNTGYKSFREYSEAYQRREEERRREERRQRWEDIFNDLGGGFTWTYTNSDQFEDFFKDFQNQGGYYRGAQGNYNQGGGYSQGYNPGGDFISQYRGACDMLGVEYTADKYEIKLAYKKMAKKYHPDLNKSENATEMFQKINAAYEFLSDENINKYKSMTNQ